MRALTEMFGGRTKKHPLWLEEALVRSLRNQCRDYCGHPDNKSGNRAEKYMTRRLAAELQAPRADTTNCQRKSSDC